MTIDDREKPSDVLARRLLRKNRTATLSTLDTETGGSPYGSLVLTACALDATPLVLLSDLARHTRNFKTDNRVSMVFASPGVEAINMSRATIIGKMEPCDDARLHDRFLRRHHGARNHMAFADFHLYQLVPESVHFIGGFGRIETLDAGDVVLGKARVEVLTEAEADIVEHMNLDHTAAIRAYAHSHADRPGLDWRMTGIDPEGCDLARNDADARVDFGTIVEDAAGARAELVRLAKEARHEI
ncbi:MAG: DUF2470 domain-containing protein [Alphaproteobacteria bacterium]|jgi:heme iron utilization protein